MRSKLARWLAAASLLVLVTTPALAASSSNTGKGWLGVSTQPTDEDLRQGLDLKQDGLLVNSVTRDSPAYRRSCDGWRGSSGVSGGGGRS